MSESQVDSARDVVVFLNLLAGPFAAMLDRARDAIRARD